MTQHAQKTGNPQTRMGWTEVLTCAGIDPNERVVEGLMSFVAKGVRTSVALSREESERRHAAELAEEEARAA